MDEYLKFHITRHIPIASYATAHLMWTSPASVDLQSVRVRYRVGSVSGTLNLVKVKNARPIDGTAFSLLSSTVPLFGDPNKRLFGTITLLRTDTSVAAGYRIQENNSVGLLFAGDLTGLEDLAISLMFKKVIS